MMQTRFLLAHRDVAVSQASQVSLRASFFFLPIFHSDRLERFLENNDHKLARYVQKCRQRGAT